MIYRLTYTLLLPNGERREKTSEFKTQALAQEMYATRTRLNTLYADVRLEEVEESPSVGGWC